jgi:Double-stranded RNA binding motif
MGKTGTQLLNEHLQRGHYLQYEEYLCEGHTEKSPQYGCKVLVDGALVGNANYRGRKKDAKEAAALMAVEALFLME